MAHLLGIQTSSPPYVVPQSRAAEELKRRMAVRPAVGRMIDSASAHSGIDTRRVVIPDASDPDAERFYPTSADEAPPDTKRRMDLYKVWSRSLAVEAASRVLQATEISASNISRLITVSCTGFSAPNFDETLISSLGLPPDVRRTHIGFMGCAASVVGMNSVLEALQASPEEGATALLVSVELCSLHLQTEPTKDNILANLIFADGCGAALFGAHSASTSKARITSTHSRLFPDSRHYMGWEIGNHGFEMMLSTELPVIIAEQAVPAIQALLAEQGLSPGAIRHWALHPGGRAILDALQTGLGLSDEQVAPSRAVLRRFGNMSSASILFVLKEVLDGTALAPEDRMCAVAFGPGLTMELALFSGGGA